jgi:hypothetical protein
MQWSAIILAVMAMAASGVAEARQAAHHRAAHRHHLARAKPRRQVFEMATGVAPAAAPYRAPAPIQADGLRTSVRYRLGHSRATAAIGYNRVAGAYEINPHEVNSAAGTQLGHPDATVGARVSIPF